MKITYFSLVIITFFLSAASRLYPMEEQFAHEIKHIMYSVTTSACLCPSSPCHVIEKLQKNMHALLENSYQHINLNKPCIQEALSQVLEWQVPCCYSAKQRAIVRTYKNLLVALSLCNNSAPSSFSLVLQCINTPERMRAYFMHDYSAYQQYWHELYKTTSDYHTNLETLQSKLLTCRQHIHDIESRMGIMSDIPVKYYKTDHGYKVVIDDTFLPVACSVSPSLNENS